MTSAGTGISHSEYNRNPTKPVHFLQVSAVVCEFRRRPGVMLTSLLARPRSGVCRHRVD